MSTYNDALRNVLADALGVAFDGGVLEIRTGSAPAGAGAATGTLLASIDLPVDSFGAAVAGVASKAGTWTTVAVASGLAGWARFRDDADTLRMDVTVGEGAGELSLDDADIVTGGTVTVNSFTITQPA